MNFAKEKDRLTSLKIIGKRYAFLFEDVWFILLQYLYFEKFVSLNSKYLAQNENELDYDKKEEAESYMLMFYNSIFTALIGLGGLTTIPYCFKMIKQGKTKTRIFYVLTAIQILFQTIFPIMRAVLVILSAFVLRYDLGRNVYDMITITVLLKNCASVGFQVWFVRIQPLADTNKRDHGDSSKVFSPPFLSSNAFQTIKAVASYRLRLPFLYVSQTNTDS